LLVLLIEPRGQIVSREKIAERVWGKGVFCSPAGQEQFFAEVGLPIATRTTAPPKLDETAQAEFKAKAEALAPKYKTELLQHA
jgi:hypothetical protein